MILLHAVGDVLFKMAVSTQLSYLPSSNTFTA